MVTDIIDAFCKVGSVPGLLPASLMVSDNTVEHMAHTPWPRSQGQGIKELKTVWYYCKDKPRDRWKRIDL